MRGGSTAKTAHQYHKKFLLNNVDGVCQGRLYKTAVNTFLLSKIWTALSYAVPFGVVNSRIIFHHTDERIAKPIVVERLCLLVAGKCIKIRQRVIEIQNLIHYCVDLVVQIVFKVQKINKEVVLNLIGGRTVARREELR